MIKVKNISYTVNNHTILQDISFELLPGELLGIIGPNGGGKSTLLNIISKRLTPSKGSVLLGSRTFSYMPQFTKLNDLMPVTVFDLISMAHRKSTQSTISDVLNLVGLNKKSATPVNLLSGGERQRALLARCLINDPEILILDEPTTGLDSTGVDQFLIILEKIKESKKNSILLVDHNLNHILKISDKIICLNRSQHWHDKKEHLTKNILESIYHCEFEHIILHADQGPSSGHQQCTHNSDDHDHE